MISCHRAALARDRLETCPIFTLHGLKTRATLFACQW